MKISPILLLAVVAVLLSARSAGAEAMGQSERVAAAWVLAFGHAPSTSELEQELKQTAASLPELVQRNRQRLQSDADLRQRVVQKAAHDAFGGESFPGDAEPAVSVVGTYSEIVDAQVRRLAKDSAMYEQVLRRVYPLVVHREIYPEEITYWTRQPALPFYLLVACVDNWARRNQPGLMLTAGTPTVAANSLYLTTARVSPAIAAELRGDAGPASENSAAASLAIAAGHNLLGASGGALVTAGHMYFAAAGADDLVKSPQR